jgi:8-amino-7-oxononanoate synthase
MGTLGKAYGSFGAYILGSSHIIEYLINRAKPIIYATSLSLYDTLLGHKSLDYILNNSTSLRAKIQKRQNIIKDILNIEIDGLIVPILINDNKKVIEIKDFLYDRGFAIGGIRQPTVPKAILRVIARLSQTTQELEELCQNIIRYK